MLLQYSVYTLYSFTCAHTPLPTHDAHTVTYTHTHSASFTSAHTHPHLRMLHTHTTYSVLMTPTLEHFSLTFSSSISASSSSWEWRSWANCAHWTQKLSEETKCQNACLWWQYPYEHCFTVCKPFWHVCAFHMNNPEKALFKSRNLLTG